jgi:hypothetical protein
LAHPVLFAQRHTPRFAAQDLRCVVVGHLQATILAAVEAGLRDCPLPEAEGDLDFPALVTFRLTDPSRLDFFQPPPPRQQS